MSPTPLIIGQAPSRTSDPCEPLSGHSGQRLADLCGLTLPEFLETFDRSNLLDRWPGNGGRKGDVFLGVRQCRELAERYRPAVSGRSVVVLGFTAAAGFGLTQPAMQWMPHWGGIFAFCPHPSGVSTWWNDPVNVGNARAFWTALVATSRQP